MIKTKTQTALDNVFNTDCTIEEAEIEGEIVSIEAHVIDKPNVFDDGQLIPVDEYEEEDRKLKTAMESDYEQVRENLKILLEKGNPMLDLAIQIAEGTENPKNMENVIKMIGQLSDVNMKLLDATSKKQDVFVKARPKVNSKFNEIMNGEVPNITNNTMFVGSPTDLLNFLKKDKENIENEVTQGD